MSEGNRREIQGGYVVIGHTSLVPSYTIFLNGDGIKELVRQLRPDEDLRITIEDKITFEAVDTHDKYSKRPPE